MGAKVDVVERLGSTSYVHATLATGEPVVAEKRENPPKTGDSIVLSFAPASLRLFTESGARVR